jgi:hypothetical protein
MLGEFDDARLVSVTDLNDEQAGGSPTSTACARSPGLTG